VQKYMGRVSRLLAKARHDQDEADLRGLSGQEGCYLGAKLPSEPAAQER
jgi:hypothetical protein